MAERLPTVGTREAEVEFLRTVARARDASGREAWDEAVPLWGTVVEANPVTAEFWSALGDARAKAADHSGAIAAYRHALDLGAGFPFDTAYRIALCHARDGRLDEALSWIERAFELGYRNLEGAQTDETFASLRDSNRFRELVGLIDAGNFSRDDGWRYDLAFFAREVKRKAFFPFRNVSEEAFDAAVARLHEDIPQLSEYEILVEMRKILVLLGDGHASAYVLDDHPLSPATLPVQFFLFEEGLFVIASTPEHASLLGAQVLRVGDSTIEDVFGAIAPAITRDNDYWLKLVVPYELRDTSLLHALGLCPSPDRVELTTRLLDGSEQGIELPAGSNKSFGQLWNDVRDPKDWHYFLNSLASPLPHYLRNQTVPYWFEYLQAEQAIYFQFNRVADDATERFADFSERLFRFIDDYAVRKLVIDVRGNNGGNTFLEMPFLHRLIGSRINRRGSLFVIIGRRTFSAAQNFSSMIERHTEAIFVGEPTGASPNFVGENINIELPYSKVGTNVSDLYWQSTWPMDHRTWIAPLLYLPPTFAAYQENRDPALEAILAWNDHLPGM